MYYWFRTGYSVTELSHKITNETVDETVVYTPGETTLKVYQGKDFEKLIKTMNVGFNFPFSRSNFSLCWYDGQYSLNCHYFTHGISCFNVQIFETGRYIFLDEIFGSDMMYEDAFFSGDIKCKKNKLFIYFKSSHDDYFGIDSFKIDFKEEKLITIRKHKIKDKVNVKFLDLIEIDGRDFLSLQHDIRDKDSLLVETFHIPDFDWTRKTNRYFSQKLKDRLFLLVCILTKKPNIFPFEIWLIIFEFISLLYF
jgi:hypothetical protein